MIFLQWKWKSYFFFRFKFKSINDYSQNNYNFDNSRKEFINNFDKEEEGEKQNTLKDNSFKEMSDKCFYAK